MTIEDIRKMCEEIIKRYPLAYTEYREERRNGKIKLASLTLKFKAENNGKKGREHEF